VQAGALKLSGGSWVGANGYTKNWDSCSSTPFLTNPSSNTVVTFDDPESLIIKTAYAQQVGLAGVNSWDISGDYNWVLTDAIRSAMGKSS